MNLDRGSSAIVFAADGEVLYCVLPDETDGAPASRAVLVATALLLMGRQRIDALVAETLRRTAETTD